jgi:hypothetical protein
MVERPDGLKIAGCFIAAVLIVSRVGRAYELRATGVAFDATATRFLQAAGTAGPPPNYRPVIRSPMTARRRSRGSPRRGRRAG